MVILFDCRVALATSGRYAVDAHGLPYLSIAGWTDPEGRCGSRLGEIFCLVFFVFELVLRIVVKRWAPLVGFNTLKYDEINDL